MDYKELGFKAGLEVHQQIDTKKLFCNCPPLVNDPNEYYLEIERTLTLSESELGKKDIAAEFEAKKQKTFIYQAKPTSSCLVELDESPPYPLNHNALKVVLEVAKLVNAEIVDDVHVMRKIVLDGSNVSGFQRTALVARNGFINTSKGKVTIPTIYLEEEAAKKVSETEKTVTYGLDRLGVPLIEISTGPELQDPEHVKEAASALGMILRSTEKVKRGLGSIRQDVNISIKNHPRVELKGFQDLVSIPKVIDKEIDRQLTEKDKVSHVRKVEPNYSTSFLRPKKGSARLNPEKEKTPIEITKKLLDSIKIPELITERAVNFEKKYNLSAQYSQEIVKRNIPFDYYAEKYNIEPKIIAHTLLEVPKELKSRFNLAKEITKENFEFIFSQLEKKKISREAILETLKSIIEGKKPEIEKYQETSLDEVESFIKELVEKNPNVSIGGLMGDIMKKFKGSIDGSLAMKLLKKYKSR